MMFKKELKTEIQIHASASKVWQAITDFKNYEHWNPFIIKASGDLRENSVLNIVMRPPGQKAQPYRVRLTKIENGKQLHWLGHFLSTPGLIDGSHIFEILQNADGSVRLVHRESFQGVLVPFVWSTFLNTHLKAGFEELNHALKKYTEGQ